MAEKVNPYLRPLYDALHDMMEFDRVERLIERGVIEVAPLAFMRGRTLNDSFVILDEAQNTTPRADEDVPHAPRLQLQGGHHRRRHPDRPRPAMSAAACVEAIDVLTGVEGIAFMVFDEADVVRHPLVQSIIRAYDQHEGRLKREREAAREGRRDREASG